MKNIVIALIAVLCVLSSPTWAKEVYKIDRKTGKVHLVVEDDLDSMTPLEEKAFQNPGEKVYNYSPETVERNRTSFKTFFFGTPTKKAIGGHRFQNETMEEIENLPTLEEESVFLWRIPTSLLLILLMVIAIKLFHKEKLKLFYTILFCIATIALLGLEYPGIFILIPIAMIFFGIIWNDEPRVVKGFYKMLSWAFYITGLVEILR